MLGDAKRLAIDFSNIKDNSSIKIISNINTDGIITSAILARTFQRLGKKFSINFTKRLDLEVSRIKEGEITFVIDSKDSTNSSTIKNVFFLKPRENTTTSEIAYIFSKELSKSNLDLSDLAIIGILSEPKDNTQEINKSILEDCKNLEIKKGLTIYPATRPLKRTLQFSTSPYIPEVTGNEMGVAKLLEETKINGEKSLLELDESEMSRLGAAIKIKQKGREIIQKPQNEIYILKIFNRKEDVREIATILKSCAKQGHPDIALFYCLGDKFSKSKIIDIYTKHTQEVVSGLKIAENLEKIDNGEIVILNARDKIKDIIVGTICSMLSTSPNYKEGTIIIGMAYNEDKLKVSARIVGREGKNIKEFLEKAVIYFKSENPKTHIEVGGHKFAAGCTLDKSKETEFIETLKKISEIEILKV